MLPSAALIPPWAATVWLRVGKSLEMQAVLRPSAAIPKVARSPRAAGPHDHRIVVVIDEIVGRHQLPSAMRSTAKSAAAASRNTSILSSTRLATRSHGVWT